MQTPLSPLVPGDSDFFGWDFSVWLAGNGDTLASTATVISQPAGLTISGVSVNGSIVTAKITAPAATSPAYYEAICTVTTTGGRTKTAVSRFLVPVL